MLTGHEILRGAWSELPAEHQRIFDFIRSNPDIFPGFFHYDLAGNVLPKLAVLQEFGFYGGKRAGVSGECGGADSTQIKMARPARHSPVELATRSLEITELR